MDEQELRRLERLVLIDLKEHFDALFAERDKREEERDKRVAQEVVSIRAAVDKAEAAADKRFALLNEFRGQAADEASRYALRENVEQIFTELRKAIKDVREERDRELDAIRAAFDEGRGRRSAFQVAVGIVVALVTVSLGLMWNNQPSRDSIRTQIRQDAPWVEDKPGVLQRITTLETRQNTVLVRLEGIDALNRFFCKTRQPQLPGC